MLADKNIAQFIPPTMEIKKPTSDELWRFYEDLFKMGQQTPVPMKVQCVHPDAQAPTKSHEDDLGWDIRCVPDEFWYKGLDDNQPVFDLMPGNSHTFSTGIKVAVPRIYGFLLRDRSSLGIKDISVKAGVIEGTYRDEWKVHLTNEGSSIHRFLSGDKIVQAILTTVVVSEVDVSDDLPPTERGKKGFGSSGR